jgi:two-component system, OmpR family, alkaline phosphatase synthesis response regulator PhoP
MKPAHILVAEDDNNIRTGLVDTLESEGYRATPAANGREAIELFASEEFDLILLDIMMPDKSGYDVCRAVRASNEDIPVIMLTAKGEEIDKVIGLQLGADDYITKPFGVHELLARISAVLRRSQRKTKKMKEDVPGPERFTFGVAEIDTRQYKARIGDNTYDISARELQLLRFFHSHPNEVLSRDRILNAVWGIEYGGTTRTLDQHVAQLRKKIEPDPARPRFLTTVYGVGYRFETS